MQSALQRRSMDVGIGCKMYCFLLLSHIQYILWCMYLKCLPLFLLGKRPLVDPRKKTFQPIDNSESDSDKRDKIFSKLNSYIPKSVGVMYWKAGKSSPQLPEKGKAIKTTKSTLNVPR